MTISAVRLAGNERNWMYEVRCDTPNCEERVNAASAWVFGARARAAEKGWTTRLGIARGAEIPARTDHCPGCSGGAR